MSHDTQVVIGMLVTLACVPVLWWLMLRGWRGRAAEQTAVLALPAPQPVSQPVSPPASQAGPQPGSGAGGEPAADSLDGVYVSTTLAHQPLERVTAHGLGTRSGLRLAVAASGLVLERDGARSFAIPAAALVGVRRTRGQAGKFTFEKEGLVVVTWRLGDVDLDTGVRLRHRAQAPGLVEAVQALLSPAGAGPAAPAGPTASAGGAA